MAADRDRLLAAAEQIAGAAREQISQLVAISTPSGDADAAEAGIATLSTMLPAAAECERVACSTAGFAPDLIATLHGGGSARVVLLGHIDTVVPHTEHRSAVEEGERLVGSGTIDMKGGVAIAAGVMRALAEHADRYAELALLIVTDEEWRQVPLAHVERFAGYDACLCFEAGERDAEGDEAIVVRRKAAVGLAVRARGVASHAGAAPDDGSNALLALAEVARAVSACHDPAGDDGLTAVPTVLRSGGALNVVPADGELLCDLRADDERAFEAARQTLPEAIDGVELESEFFRMWPGMDSREATESLLAAAGELLGRPIEPAERGGASDASYLAPRIALTVDGLGPIGGAAHNPGEHLLPASLRPRAEVALAIGLATLDLVDRQA